MEQWETNNNRSNLLVNSLVFQKLFNLLKMEEVKNKEIQEQKHWRLDIGETVHEDLTPKDLNVGLFKHFIAGGTAGFFSRTTTAPLDRLKVNPTYTVPSALRYLHKEGGILSFWRGNGINVTKIAPESAFKFMAYEQMKRIVKWKTGHSQLNMLERFFAGGCAGALAQTIIYPMEVLKTRLALRKTGEIGNGLGGLFEFVKKMRVNEGILCFYKGFLPNLIGIFPYAGIDLTVYETIKNWWIYRHPQVSEPGVIAVISCGVISSTCGQILTYPLALVRTRLQALNLINDQPTTMKGQFIYIYTKDGIKGLYRGFIPNFMKVIPAVSISYVTYEQCRKMLGVKMS
ncbi:unnamed protein product [Meloidogyne enterolobii]|uniref:Uncharacterized protein n=1 Tax=Meloidogyne enterolobii TaxID=390850 RepID=A0ACB0YQQ4_MELEN